MAVVVKTYEVVMATCNGERFLDQQIESIIHQTILPQRLLIADDCSLDQSLSCLHHWQHKSAVPIELVHPQEEYGSLRDVVRSG